MTFMKLLTCKKLHFNEIFVFNTVIVEPNEAQIDQNNPT